MLAWLSLAREAQRARGTASEIWPTLANLGGAQRAATLRTEGHSSEIARRTSSSFCLCCAESGPPHEPCTNQLARNGYVYGYVYGYGFYQRLFTSRTRVFARSQNKLFEFFFYDTLKDVHVCKTRFLKVQLCSKAHRVGTSMAAQRKSNG